MKRHYLRGDASKSIAPIFYQFIASLSKESIRMREKTTFQMNLIKILYGQALESDKDCISEDALREINAYAISTKHLLMPCIKRHILA